MNISSEITEQKIIVLRIFYFIWKENLEKNLDLAVI